MSTVRVLTVDDHASFRSTARALVAATEGFEVAGEVATGEEAVAAVERLHPDLVLMDVRLPGIDGYEATRQISRIRPEVDDPLEGHPAARRGTAPFVRKQDLRPNVLVNLWAVHGHARKPRV